MPKRKLESDPQDCEEPLESHHKSIRTAKLFICEVEQCRKAFSTQSNLINHTRVHSGEKPFICDYAECKQTFATSSNLIRHKRIHSGHKPFICDYAECTKSFTNSSGLITHKRIHSGEKPFICNYAECTKSFSDSSSLITHKRIHSGEKPFICNFEDCQQSFSQSGDLVAHKRIHSGEKPYICTFPECKKSFNQSSHLATHKRIHSLIYLCFCEQCGYGFKQKGNLDRHILNVHSGQIKVYEKRKEKVIFDLLENANIAFDYNVGIDFCKSSNTKTRAFADFIIQNGNGVLIIEVDERSHGQGNLKDDQCIVSNPACENRDYGYNVKCEQSRMLDMVNALRLAGETLPIGFLRYNPDKFCVDGSTIIISDEERQNLLLQFINEWNPIQDFEIHYCCYDSYTVGEAIRSSVWDHKDFDSNLQSCVFRVA